MASERKRVRILKSALMLCLINDKLTLPWKNNKTAVFREDSAMQLIVIVFSCRFQVVTRLLISGRY